MSLIKINLFLLAVLYYNNCMYRTKSTRTRELKRLIDKQERVLRSGINSFMISLDIFELEPKQKKDDTPKFDIENDFLIPFLKKDLFASYISAQLIEFVLEISNDLDFVELKKFVKEVKANPRKFVHKTPDGDKENKKERSKPQDDAEGGSKEYRKKLESVIEFRSTFGNDLDAAQNILKATATFGEDGQTERRASKSTQKSSGKMDEEKQKMVKSAHGRPSKQKMLQSDGKLSQSQKIHAVGRAKYFFEKFIKPGFKKSKDLKKQRKIFKIHRSKKKNRRSSIKRVPIGRPPTATTKTITNSSAFSLPRSKRSLSLGPCLGRKYIIRPKKVRVGPKDSQISSNLIDLKNYHSKSHYLKEEIRSKNSSQSKPGGINQSPVTAKRIFSGEKIEKLVKSPKWEDPEIEILNQLERNFEYSRNSNVSRDNSRIKDASFDGYTHGFSLKDWENDIVAKATPRTRKTKRRKSTLTFN